MYTGVSPSRLVSRPETGANSRRVRPNAETTAATAVLMITLVRDHGLEYLLAATVLALQASHALAEGNPGAAITLLDRGAREAGDESPALRGVLTGAAASVCRDCGDPSAEQRFEAARQGARGLVLPV